MKQTILTVAQIVACVVCCVCGLVPVVEKTGTYWGANGVSYNDAPPILHQVDGHSPAERDGLRVDDMVLAAAGSAPLNNPRFDQALTQLKPGESVVLRVRRPFGSAGKEIDITAHGVEPEIAAIYYRDLSLPIAGGVSLVVALVIFATQPIEPSPNWRAILVMVAGLGMAVVFFLGLAIFRPLSVFVLQAYHARQVRPTYSELKDAIGLIAALLLAILGAWNLRSSLKIRTTARNSSPIEGLTAVN